jgi:uncharacterized protein (DUF362 family)
MNSTVAVLKTSPTTVLDDYGRLMRMASYQEFIDNGIDTLIKLNLSWTKFYPACSSQPWQLDGVLKTLIQDSFDRSKIFPVENKTVVTRPRKGAKNNLWLTVLRNHQLEFVPLTEVNWSVYKFKSDFLKIHEIFPEGIEIPSIYPGKQVIHLPTVKTHGHSVTTGAIKNSFGGLLKETRHHAHRFIHEVLVDLMLMQKELHPGIFAVVDGTVCGNGAGPRTMSPEVKNYLLAGADQVAVDAVAAKMMGFDPLKIDYLRMCHEREIGIADPDRIQVIGEDVSDVNFGFRVRRSPVIAGDQLIRRGFLRPLEKVLLRSALAGWAPVASNVYHDFFWYQLIGKRHLRRFEQTGWGRLRRSYKHAKPDRLPHTVKLRMPRSGKRSFGNYCYPSSEEPAK